MVRSTSCCMKRLAFVHRRPSFYCTRSPTQAWVDASQETQVVFHGKDCHGRLRICGSPPSSLVSVAILVQGVDIWVLLCVQSQHTPANNAQRPQLHVRISSSSHTIIHHRATGDGRQRQRVPGPRWTVDSYRDVHARSGLLLDRCNLFGTEQVGTERTRTPALATQQPSPSSFAYTR